MASAPTTTTRRPHPRPSAGDGQPGSTTSTTAAERKEDWKCVACNDHQFARNTHCRRCGRARPTEAVTRAYLARRKAAEQHQPQRDWACVSCDDIQTARNVRCRRCGAAKPSADVEQRYMAQKRAQAEATVLDAQRRKEEAAARRRREAEAFAAHLRRLSAPGWAELRLLFVGAHDEASPLSWLPMEMVVAIARWSLAVPECWASTRLAWFKATARADPAGKATVTLSDGHELEYDQTAAANKKFTVCYWRREQEERRTRDVQEHWSEGMFLAKASYDPQWHAWVESGMSVTPGHVDGPCAT